MNRRGFLATGGALIVSFALAPDIAHAQQKLPGSLKETPLLDSWIHIAANGTITVFTGKAELGQGVKTALLQIAAEELKVDVRGIELITADTSRTPDEQYTSGSQSMQESGTAIMNAAAQVRGILVDIAAKRFGIPADRLIVRDGKVTASDGRSAGYGELVAGADLHVEAKPQSSLSDPKNRAVMGKAILRVDIPAKLTGRPHYVQDLRLPDMLHARVVRPPGYGARLRSLDTAAAERMPGVQKIVRNGSFVAVVAQREFQAISAMRVLAKAAQWDERETLPVQAELAAHLRRLQAQDYVIHDVGTPAAPGERTIQAEYFRPYQIHGSIGPSCAVALLRDGQLTLWSHTQGVYPLRNAIAEMTGIAKEQVRCIHVEGSGCYGHNGADDAGADAALIALAVPGRPVRVHWMREDEHAWEPYGPAMLSRASAELDGGKISSWQYEVWSNTHSTRPAPAGNLATAWHLEKPFTPPPPKPIPQPTGGGDRNAIPLYKIPNAKVVHHFITEMPLRVSALRALGAYMNIFSVESFMDELALAARVDPEEFRLRHLEDSRARDVVQMAAERFGWQHYRKQNGRGRGFAFAKYKNLAAYCAIACEAEVERESGKVRMTRAVAAIDSGEAVSPDGIRNQIEGGIIQSLSWTLYEAVSFNRTRITSQDWAGYPIMRFTNLPDSVEVHVINRPGAPFLGTGEAAQGPTAAAIANAVADAAGVRIREIPFAAGRIRRAIGL